MSSPTPLPDPYPYGPDWKAGVDRMGEEWRAYCEAVQCLKWYFADKLNFGKDRAKELYERYCAGLDRPGQAARLARLKRDFLLIGAHEGETIAAAVERDLSRRACAEAA